MRAILFPFSVLIYILMCGICIIHFSVGEALFDPSMEWPQQDRTWLIASQWAALLGPLLGGGLLYLAFGRVK